MANHLLYYYIEWPESQKWLDNHNLLEEGYVIASDQTACFVEKETYDLCAGDPSVL